MEQDNLLEYLYQRLKNEHFWFVTKSDITNSWEIKPKKYYTLDEYGEIKDKKKVEKEINDYLGDGAETIEEAVSLFIADAVCDGSITTTDYLTTIFKDKPVEYSENAVEVKNIEPNYIKPEIKCENNKLKKEDIQVLKKLDSNNLRHPELKTNIKDFYTKSFNDDLGNDINSNITFLDLYRVLKNKEDVYDLIGVEDSVIRERLFYELADILNQGIKYVYDLWQTGAYEGHPGIVKENVQRRLEEENNKSLNLISDMFKSKDFDSDSKAGQIIMRTSNLFNVLSDKGYDVQVSFDNGESTNTILLGQQGGSILITITDTNQPLRAFTDGSFEITEDNIKTLEDVRKEIETI